MSQNNIVILGGSYAGISVTHNTLKHIRPYLPSTYRVILISTSSHALCRPACPRALISDSFFDQNKLFISIPQQFEQYGSNFRFIQGTATELRTNGRVVKVDIGGVEEEIQWHALIIATGASTTSPLFGFNRDEVFLRSSWADFREALPSAKSIVIAGGGPTGVETAGELGEYLNGRAGWSSSKLSNSKVAISLVCAGEQLLPNLRAAIGKKAETYLADVGVNLIKNARVASVSLQPTTPDLQPGTPGVGAKATITLDNGTTMESDLYIPAFGTYPNTSFVANTSLLTPSGHITTNPLTLRVDAAGPRVYAIGDVSDYAAPCIHQILAAVPVLTANMKRDLLAASSPTVDEDNVAKRNDVKGVDRVFVEDKRETQLVPIGRSRGVGAANGWGLPSWLVWLIKGRDYWLWTTGRLWSGRQWAREG